MRAWIVDHDKTMRVVDIPYPAEPFLSLATFEGIYGKVSGIWRIRWYRLVPNRWSVTGMPEYEYMHTCEYDHYDL